MECKREEAIRAKTIAEKKFANKDYTGAKKFTLKAQTLYPLLDGIPQMLMTLDVYISSDNKINGESDWYGVLDVKPSDDYETIRKQYRKLVLTLHPDKNKSVGADGAFKIVSEAWSLLSDKAKRLAYNHRRNPRGFQHKVSYQSGRSSVSTSFNGVHSFANRPASKPDSPVLDRFWTMCNRCEMYYEYLKEYVNHLLLCRICLKPFQAVEMAPPINIPIPAHLRNQNSGEGMYNSGRSTTAAQATGWGASGYRHPLEPSRNNKRAW